MIAESFFRATCLRTSYRNGMSHFDNTYQRSNRRVGLIRSYVKAFRGGRTKFAYRGTHFADPGESSNIETLIDLSVPFTAQNPTFWSRQQDSVDLRRLDYAQPGDAIHIRESLAMLVDRKSRSEETLSK
jgi:hypothetical protein